LKHRRVWLPIVEIYGEFRFDDGKKYQIQELHNDIYPYEYFVLGLSAQESALVTK